MEINPQAWPSSFNVTEVSKLTQAERQQAEEYGRRLAELLPRPVVSAMWEACVERLERWPVHVKSPALEAAVMAYQAANEASWIFDKALGPEGKE